MAAYGRIRAANDIDVWVKATVGNAPCVNSALVQFDAPLHGLNGADIPQPGVMLQIGVAPFHPGVLASIDDVTFSDAWRARLNTRFADQSVALPGEAYRIRNQRAGGRSQDSADVAWKPLTREISEQWLNPI
jgi:hypothetical protein